MDEITLINLLNKICEKNANLTWKLNCKYHDGVDTAIMQVTLFHSRSKRQVAQITFCLNTGKIMYGKHQSMVAFRRSTHLIDALLEILHYESYRIQLSPSYN